MAAFSLTRTESRGKVKGEIPEWSHMIRGERKGGATESSGGVERRRELAIVKNAFAAKRTVRGDSRCVSRRIARFELGAMLAPLNSTLQTAAQKKNAHGRWSRGRLIFQPTAVAVS